MTLKILKPRKALNKAFLKVKPNRTEIEKFKSNLITLLNTINDIESEEFHKNLISDFLKKTYYDPNYFINTKGRNDLVIHNGNKASTTVGVIIEAKKPTNKSEMLTTSKLNVKAFHELVLYYLRERITHKNIEVKYLIVTNINEWFVFDATIFERLFAQNKLLVKKFIEFEEKNLVDTKTDFFYREIVEPYIAELDSEIECTYFNIQDFYKTVVNQDKADDVSLISLFKLLSPEHLLKLPFANDSNSLDKTFYSELLHIIGLKETRVGSKKIIERNKAGERITGTILENAIVQLDTLDKLSRVDKPSQYGKTEEERKFNVGLELTITWINRILFLKLLEAQLISYHKGDKSYSFLNLERIKNYDDLNSLFFQVLAHKHDERNDDVKKLFEKVPYLNSSLFEPTEIEQSTLFISNLKDDKVIPIHSNTILKDNFGKKRKGDLSTLQYLFEFLDAYDFGAESGEEIQEDNKALINASVLGLIFEKINGYKDGSFFTPGFITMYMCRESIRKAVVQKFNETKNWDCKNLDDLYDKIEDRQEANSIVNSLKICDPAVGSGHFLVSALNEIISIKNDLRILQYRDGRRLKEYNIEVINDELIITDHDGDLFEYNPNNKESQRIQETLFHEKQTIIENCLFGVDINPNSVKICRLRLWIELLKNTYYKNSTELETLPNIDINIKCGNSLISRYALDIDIKQALKSSKWTIDSYRNAVNTYRNAESKEQKREMLKLIADIKSNFRSEISNWDPKKIKLNKLKGDYIEKTNPDQLFERSKKEENNYRIELQRIKKEIETLENYIQEITSNKIFDNSFEWRIEFPEVLNDDGLFIGFDVVIGNPPYVSLYGNKGILIDSSTRSYYQTNYSHVKGYNDRINLMNLFVELSSKLVKQSGNVSLIVNKTIAVLPSYINLRDFILSNLTINYTAIDFSPFEAIVDCLILDYSKTKPSSNYAIKYLTNDFNNVREVHSEQFKHNRLKEFISSKNNSIMGKIDDASEKLGQLLTINRGVNIGGCFQNFLSKNKLSDMYYKYIPGTKNIKKYYYEWNEEDGYCKLDLELESSLRISGKTLVLGDITRFEKMKLFIPESSQTITAVYSDENVCSAYGVMVGTLNEADVNLHFIAGLLNSKLITFYCLEKEILRKGNKATPHVGVKGLNSIPIKRNKEIELEIARISDDIHIKKLKSNNTSNEENLINILVYKLYDLSEAEIKIVDNYKIDYL